MTRAMPEPWRLERLSIVARNQNDSTAALRERHPALSWVWDELDELRATADGSVPYAEFVEVEESLEKWVSLARSCAQCIDKLVDGCEMTAEVQTELERVAALLDRRDCA